MTFEYLIRVDTSAEHVSAFLLDVQAVASCVPGVEAVEPDGAGGYRGRMKVKVGPVSLTLAGTVVEEARDEAAGTARLRAEAADRRVGGSVRALLELTVIAVGPAETDVRVVSHAHLLGKLGEFGQPILRRKADQIFAEFSESLRQRLNAAR